MLTALDDAERLRQRRYRQGRIIGCILIAASLLAIASVTTAVYLLLTLLTH